MATKELDRDGWIYVGSDGKPPGNTWWLVAVETIAGNCLTGIAAWRGDHWEFDGSVAGRVYAVREIPPAPLEPEAM